MSDRSLTDAAPDATTERPGRRPDPVQRLAVFAVRWLVIKPGWWLLRRTGRALWRGRDLHAAWWAAVATYAAAATAHATGTPWQAVAATAVGLAVAAGWVQTRWPRLPLPPDTLAGAVAIAGVWSAVAVAVGPWTRPAAASWAVWTLALTVWWWRNPEARDWRHLRARVRNWRATLPVVLAELGAAGVVVAARPRVEAGGRVVFPLRMAIGVTRAALDKLRPQIEAGMHWPEGSIKEIRHDPAHTSAARVLLVWQDGKIKARKVAFDQSKVPQSIHDPLWIGIDDQGRDVFMPQYTKTGMTRGLYGGMPSSAKSNLLRMIARLRAYCPDTLIIVIDRKNAGMTFASLLPRIDWIATTRDEAARVMEAFAAAVPLRGQMLRPEHNQVLPLSEEVPGVVIIYDEFAEDLGKRRHNQPIIDAARIGLSQGRAGGWGAEIASQYLSQGSLHPELRPLFDRGAAGRTVSRADAQFVLRDWNRVDCTLLPLGAFYLQIPGEVQPRLVYTPEVTDEMLARAAAETAHLAPRLEASTAERLPHYAGRWGRLPDHLLPYCSAEQREMVKAARARQAAAAGEGVTRLRTAAAAAPPRLVVTERIDDPSDDGDASRAALDAMCDALEAAAASGELVRTKDLVEIAERHGRSRSWATARAGAWHRQGVTSQAGRGRYRVACHPGEVRARVGEVEAGLGVGRRARPGGDRP